jgi:hypothetical protein
VLKVISVKSFLTGFYGMLECRSRRRGAHAAQEIAHHHFT